jgi:hypothetical protein
MPLPEGYLPREGDILVIHVQTQFDVEPTDKNVHVRLLGGNSYQKFGMPLMDVERLWARHWNVDDEVQLISADPAGRRPGKVLAVDGERVWVKFYDKDSPHEHMTLHINQIEPRQLPPTGPTTGEDAAFDVAGAAVEMTAITEPAPYQRPEQILSLKDEPL